MLRKILVPFGYFLLSSVLVFVTVVLVFMSRGYGYDFKSKKVIYNGLAVIGSFPTGASVKIDGKPVKQKTPFRSTLEAGEYDFEVSKEGYIPWKKRLSIPASGVTWAQYVLLFPKELKPLPVGVVSGNVTTLFATRDRKRLGFLTSGAESGLWVLSGDEKAATKVYAPKPAVAEVAAEIIDEPVWSEDGSHILYRVTQGDKVSYRIVSAGGGTPINLTEQFGFNLAGLRFNPANWREMYWVSPEGLRRLDVEAKTTTLVVSGLVPGFTFAGDRLIYVENTPLGKSVLSIDRSGRKEELIQSLAESDNYQMLYSNFQGKDYLAVLPNKTATVTLYSDIYSSNPVAKVVSKAAGQMIINNDGRYLVFWSQGEFGSYDIEHDRLAGPVKFSGAISYFGWFDNFHLLVNTGGKLEITEYDGANTTVLDQAANVVSPAYGGDDARRIFWLGGGPAKDQIMALDLKR